MKVDYNRNQKLTHRLPSQMFVRTLGYKGRSRIEYLFRSVKRTDSLNSLKAPIDGRKNNRVKSDRTHDEKFLAELYQFVESFRCKKNSRPVIRDHKPIDLYRILCERSGYELIYENKNVQIRRKENSSAESSEESGCSSASQPAVENQPNRLNTGQHFVSQSGQSTSEPSDHPADRQPEPPILPATIDQSTNVTVIGEYYEDSMNLTNGPILYINEMSNEISNEISNPPFTTTTFGERNPNNFKQFNQTINQYKGRADSVGRNDAGQAALSFFHLTPLHSNQATGQMVVNQVSQASNHSNQMNQFAHEPAHTVHQSSADHLATYPVGQRTVQEDQVSSQIRDHRNSDSTDSLQTTDVRSSADSPSKANRICSYSYFLRFLKKHHFEFK